MFLKIFIILGICFGFSYSQAQAKGPAVIKYPGDGDASLQDAVDRACTLDAKGIPTVKISAGTYHEAVIAFCPIRMIGAGIDRTVIDGTNALVTFQGVSYPIPFGALVSFGGGPPHCDPTGRPNVCRHPDSELIPELQPICEAICEWLSDGFDIPSKFEVAHMTVRGSSDGLTFGGIWSAWADDAEIHHVKIENVLVIGIGGHNTKLNVHHVSVDTVFGFPAESVSSCIANTPFFFFTDQYPDGRHLNGGRFHHNRLSNCNTGIFLDDNIDVKIAFNRIKNTNRGVSIRNSANVAITHNTISESEDQFFSFTGLAYGAAVELRNANDVDILFNVFHSNSSAVWDRIPDCSVDPLSLFGPNSGNLAAFNLLINNGAFIRTEGNVQCPGTIPMGTAHNILL